MCDSLKYPRVALTYVFIPGPFKVVSACPLSSIIIDFSEIWDITNDIA